MKKGEMMDDLISRQAAIDALKEAFNPSITNFVKAKMAIDNLPPAQPEVLACGEGEKGKWIDRGWSGDGRGNSWHEWECSECKHITKGAKWDFCPNCGADLRGDAEAPKKCDTCRHVKSQWFNRCADCNDYELWEGKEE